MAANNAPIFTEVPLIGSGVWLPATTANVKSDGVGTIATDMLLLLTAGSDGAFINRVRVVPQAGTAATATTATVARLYISTQAAGATTNVNTHQFAEVACPAQTADQTTTATNFLEIPCGFYIPTTYTILASMHHAAAANTSWKFIVFAGNY